jgi:ectoine hydroxylase-related dioxygenase (phytanoyl-CoA dioxygenase family)
VLLSREQVEFYDRSGYLVIERALGADWLVRVNGETTRILERAWGMTASDSVLDLEDSHKPDLPRVRRIKEPHNASPLFWELLRDPAILEPMTSLIGPNLRLKTTKLNMKSARFGAPVEWHQDWAFYPHTNDDILAVGVMLDDVDDENGPLLVLPGTHKGPVYSHHHEGVFCGAVPADCDGVNFDDAVRLTGPAGSISIHHARVLHASDLNRSARGRRVLFFEVAAADAWPLLGTTTKWTDLDAFDALMICGEPTVEPRMVAAPVRIPLPKNDLSSIYQAQKSMGTHRFARYGEPSAKS